jgi:Type II secretion system (T2SS), protein F
MTATTQTNAGSSTPRIGASHPTTTGKRTTLPRNIAAVVLTVLALSIPFRTSGSRRSRARRLGRGTAWGRGSIWGRSRRPAWRSASLERPSTDARRTHRAGPPLLAGIKPGREIGRGAGPGPRPFSLGSPLDPRSLGQPSRSGRPHPSGSLQPSGEPDPPDLLGRSGERGRRVRSDHPSGPLERAGARILRPGRAAAVRREMEEGVPEVVDVLRATVAAGINPRRALQAAAEGAPAALEAVLGQAIRAAELGAGAGRALATAAEAEHLSELALAGEALDLAETTGAPPGPVLAGVATAAADRVRSRRAMMAATAQARLSARVVAAMAPAFLGVLALTAPSDAAFLIREPLGWATLAAATTFELLGIWWATHIVRGPAP